MRAEWPHAAREPVCWNFRHLVLRARWAVHVGNFRLGCPPIEIVSPEEV
jgi:hypothetical protein